MNYDVKRLVKFPGLISELAALFPTTSVMISENVITMITPARLDFYGGNVVCFAMEDYAPGILSFLLHNWSVAFRKYAVCCPHFVIEYSNKIDLHSIVDSREKIVFEGYDVTENSVLVMFRDKHQSSANQASIPSYSISQFSNDSDWQALTDLFCSEFESPEESISLIEWRIAHFAKKVDRSEARWWGIWENDSIVASAGLIIQDDFGRMQEVVTRSSHRQMGICTFLCSHILNVAFEELSLRQVIVIAEENSIAKHIYTKLGFQQSSRQYVAVKKLS